jgi:hypothetical protein
VQYEELDTALVGITAACSITSNFELPSAREIVVQDKRLADAAAIWASGSNRRKSNEVRGMSW